jgi:hypothetical protein
MATIHKARETATDYIFEICDDPSTCTHENPSEEHRRYVWGKDGIGMSVSELVGEIKLLEASLSGGPAEEGTPLSVEGQIL